MSNGYKNGPTEKITSTHVRFKKWEYEKISRDAVDTGKSIPFLLRRKYFTGKVPRILMTVDDRKAVLSELRSCRDGINKVVVKVDEGYLEGWHTECAEIARKLTAIETLMVAIYGRR